MKTFNIDKDFVSTVLAKVLILLLNFAAVIFTTQMWGSEGKGFIAIFAADISLVATFTNILTNSSVSFFLKKIGHSPLATLAFLWTFIVSAVAAVLVAFTDASMPVLPFFVVAVLSGCITFHSSLFLGVQRIFQYNLATLLMSALLLLFMFAFNYFLPEIGYHAYFYAQILSYFIVLVICQVFTHRIFGRIRFAFSLDTFKKAFNFGWQEELSAFMQFLNARLCFYLIGIYADMSSVGIFSVGVTISEAIWVFSRSMALVQYSKVLKMGDTAEAWRETRRVTLITLAITVFCIAVAACVPMSVFEFVFGDGFGEAKIVILMLAIGIAANAVALVLFNYFSALGRLKILLLRSFAGLVVTLALAFWLIPMWNIEGACVVNSCSYLVSSILLVGFFVKNRRNAMIG
ncbi:MAG: polysaccharide biosynthesis C-terminal domain-containing protein [Bacteroidales bacterium]|nr:polysaccharide biosynthesis C-terminal domain-containing protein [Bacteroidales bacterium]